MIEITYQSTEEREQIIDEQTQAGHILTCEKNISGGNYLIFNTTSELMPEPTELELLKEDNASLWYESMIQSTRVEANETEVANLWYELMMGGI